MSIQFTGPSNGLGNPNHFQCSPRTQSSTQDVPSRLRQASKCRLAMPDIAILELGRTLRNLGIRPCDYEGMVWILGIRLYNVFKSEYGPRLVVQTAGCTACFGFWLLTRCLLEPSLSSSDLNLAAETGATSSAAPRRPSPSERLDPHSHASLPAALRGAGHRSP